MNAVPGILGLSDIVDRWVYTREGIRLLMKTDEAFPPSIGAINKGRNRFWLESDIRDYERRRPWLTDNARKEIRVLYGLRKRQWAEEKADGGQE